MTRSWVRIPLSAPKGTPRGVPFLFFGGITYCVALLVTIHLRAVRPRMAKSGGCGAGNRASAILAKRAIRKETTKQPAERYDKTPTERYDKIPAECYDKIPAECYDKTPHHVLRQNTPPSATTKHPAERYDKTPHHVLRQNTRPTLRRNTPPSVSTKHSTNATTKRPPSATTKHSTNAMAKHPPSATTKHPPRDKSPER